jgi:hypothetical protein
MPSVPHDFLNFKEFINFCKSSGLMLSRKLLSTASLAAEKLGLKDRKNAVGTLGPTLFVRDFAEGPYSPKYDLGASYFSPHRSSALLGVIRLIDFATQLTAVLHAGSLISCHNFLSLHFSLRSRSKPGRFLFIFASVTLLVDSLYAEARETVNSQAALSASIPVLISSLSDISSEACL